ncbi:MAG: HNH endonuclease [Dehalococcoidia bacterium]
MMPFEKYPGDGAELLPRMASGTARRDYGLKLQRLTGQTHCAYCGISLVDSFDHWLLLSVDHVIPSSECKRIGIPTDWAESYSNTVLCCLGCNGFGNRYTIPWNESAETWSLDRFFCLRNRVFDDRKSKIMFRRAEEVRFFENKPWSH